MLSLGIIPDYREENWPSMDLVADMLMAEINSGRVENVRAASLCPPFRRRAMRLPFLGARNAAFNTDRFLNRMRDYPRHLSAAAKKVDFFHVCDHAYANVVHALPAERIGVFCHDLDTFRCLFQPNEERRPRWFRAMMRRVLGGLEKAALIFHTTGDIRRQIIANGIADQSKLIQALYGVSSVFTPSSDLQEPLPEILKQFHGSPYILHVGSCIPRKRIDVLLEIFAGLRRLHPGLRLLQVGGVWSAPQREQIARLGIAKDVLQAGRQTQQVIAGLYRTAIATVQPSDAEGFGLPIAEALACGSIVVASAIPSLIEAGGNAALYCPAGAIEDWIDTLDRIVRDKSFAPGRAMRLAHAAKFSWTEHARRICDAYRTLSAKNN
jgi:glycosyltransferase involved in cell wall biosynthesis